MDYTQIDTIIEKNESMMHIECTKESFLVLSKLIHEHYHQKGVSIIYHDEGKYEHLSIKSYLKFYFEIGKPQLSFESILNQLDLETHIRKKMNQLEPDLLKRVFIARSLCMGSEILLIEDPIENMDTKGAQKIVSVLEWMFEQGIVVVSASTSFRSVCLMPGNAYYIKNQELVPLFQSLDQDVIDSVSANNSGVDRIDIRIDGKTLMINISDILFAESIDSVCNLFVKNSYIPTHYTLDELQTRLERWGFFRSHRSYLVNVQRIAEVKQWTRNSYVITMEGESSVDVPLSKRRYQEFQELLRSE